MSATGTEPVSAENLRSALGKVGGRFSTLWEGAFDADNGAALDVPGIDGCSLAIVSVGYSSMGGYRVDANVIVAPGALDVNSQYTLSGQTEYTAKVSGTSVTVSKTGGSTLHHLILAVYGLKAAGGGSPRLLPLPARGGGVDGHRERAGISGEPGHRTRECRAASSGGAVDRREHERHAATERVGVRPPVRYGRKLGVVRRELPGEWGRHNGNAEAWKAELQLPDRNDQLYSFQNLNLGEHRVRDRASNLSGHRRDALTRRAA